MWLLRSPLGLRQRPTYQHQGGGAHVSLQLCPWSLRRSGTTASAADGPGGAPPPPIAPGQGACKDNGTKRERCAGCAFAQSFAMCTKGRRHDLLWPCVGCPSARSFASAPLAILAACPKTPPAPMPLEKPPRGALAMDVVVRLVRLLLGLLHHCTERVIDAAQPCGGMGGVKGAGAGALEDDPQLARRGKTEFQQPFGQARESVTHRTAIVSRDSLWGSKRLLLACCQSRVLKLNLKGSRFPSCARRHPPKSSRDVRSGIHAMQRKTLHDEARTLAGRIQRWVSVGTAMGLPSEAQVLVLPQVSRSQFLPDFGPTTFRTSGFGPGSGWFAAEVGRGPAELPQVRREGRTGSSCEVGARAWDLDTTRGYRQAFV